jgi:hypothetical protein
MLSTLRSKLSYANVVGTLALFVALGGSSYAAISLSSNSVKSKHIGKGQVKRSDLGKNAVNSAKVANYSLRVADFKRGQLPAGPQGPIGPPGVSGSAGSPAASMLMGRVPSTLISQSTNSSVAYPPLGLATTAGNAMLSPNQTVVLRDLAVFLTSAPGPAATRTAYVGVSGDLPPGPAISCAISGPATSCNSGAETVAIPAGSRLVFAVSNGAVAPVNTSVEFGYRATIP